MFSEHPTDTRNRPGALGIPLFERGALSHRALPLSLQALTQKALVQGLLDPNQRPASREWADALGNTLDELFPCSRCKQIVPFPSWEAPQERRCPLCGASFPRPHPAVLQLYEERGRGNFVAIERRVVLGNGFRVYPDVVNAGQAVPLSRRGVAPAGHMEWDGERGCYALVLDTDSEWTVRSPDGSGRILATRGKGLPLVVGHYVRFGDGGRMGIVLP